MAKQDTKPRFAHNLYVSETEMKTVFLTKHQHDAVMKLNNAGKEGYLLCNTNEGYKWLEFKSLVIKTNFVEFDNDADRYITASELRDKIKNINICAYKVDNKILYKLITLTNADCTSACDFKMSNTEYNALQKLERPSMKGANPVFRWHDGTIHMVPEPVDDRIKI